MTGPKARPRRCYGCSTSTAPMSQLVPWGRVMPLERSAQGSVNTYAAPLFCPGPKGVTIFLVSIDAGCIAVFAVSTNDCKRAIYRDGSSEECV